MIQYLEMADCIGVIFPYIHRNLTATEQAPDYRAEASGMGELDKVLAFMKSDYYPSFHDKASYVLCSIAGSQYFSNGNKRLGIAVLMAFLALNQAGNPTLDATGFRALLSGHFPLHQWEDNAQFQNPHALFLYNLAIVIGNRNVWGGINFDILKEKTSEMFELLHPLQKS